jgi:LPS export ABC transporter protein LptC
MKMHRRLIPILVLILSHVFSLSCSFDYDEATVDEELSEEIPDSISFKFSQVIVYEDGARIKLEAERVEVYEKLNQITAYGLHFEEYGADGELLAEGKANKAIYDMETEDAEFSGSVIFTSIQEKATVKTEGIYWEDESRMLTTPPDVLVLFEKDDGSFIEGKELEADLRRMEIRFANDVRGRINIEDK